MLGKWGHYDNSNNGNNNFQVFTLLAMKMPGRSDGGGCRGLVYPWDF